jgi:CHASE2 domain-containing sensor protein
MIVLFLVSIVIIIFLSFKIRLVREAILISIVTIVLTIAAYLISETSLFKVYVYPESFALKEFEVLDYAFVHLRPEPLVDERIVLVNIGTYSRSQIAQQLQIISSLKPRVIGIDALFNCEGVRDSINCPQLLDTLGNLMLKSAIQEAGKVVLATKLLQTDSTTKLNTEELDSVEISDPMFSNYAEQGFVTIPTEATFQEDIKTSRTIFPSKAIRGKRELAFSVRVAMIYDSIKATKFLARNRKQELINFRGNIAIRVWQSNSRKKDDSPTNFDTRYFVIDAEDVLTRNFSSELFKDKIVVMGYLGDYLGDNNDALQKKFFTPLNRKISGRSSPDMFSSVIHANVISMILDEDYLDEFSNVEELGVAFLCCFIHVLILLLVFVKFPVWYDLTAVSLVIIQLGAYSWLRLYLFVEFNLKLSLVATITSLAIASIAVVLYKELLPFLVNKFRSKGEDVTVD